MKKVMLVILALLVLAACGNDTTGRRVAIPNTGPVDTFTPTGAVVATDSVETGKSAAEMLADIQENPVVVQSTGVKEGTFYPPITSTATGKDALAEKTDALMRQGAAAPSNDADQSSGPKYHDSDGDVINLPDDYDDSKGD